MFSFQYHKGIIKLELDMFVMNLYFVESAAALNEFFYLFLKACL